MKCLISTTLLTDEAEIKIELVEHNQDPLLATLCRNKGSLLTGCDVTHTVQ